jgi:hypothetical protein
MIFKNYLGPLDCVSLSPKFLPVPGKQRDRTYALRSDKVIVERRRKRSNFRSIAFEEKRNP